MNRLPNTTIYNIFLTIIIACAVLWLLYIITPETNYNVYYIKKKE